MTPDEFEAAILSALKEIVPKDARFWFTGLPVTPVARDFDLASGSVTIHIGDCRLIEASSIITPLEKALRAAVPQLKRITCAFCEV